MGSLCVLLKDYGSPGPFWEQELESLHHVIEMKNERIHELEKQLLLLEMLVSAGQAGGCHLLEFPVLAYPTPRPSPPNPLLTACLCCSCQESGLGQAASPCHLTPVFSWALGLL